MDKEKRIKELKEIMQRAEKIASCYHKTSEKNMALDYYGYFAAKKSLENMGVKHD